MVLQSPINTRILDHIIYLTPTGSLEETSQQFRELGFNVLPGGTHADGLTENALVVFADGVYLELISFTHPTSRCTPGSEELRQRERHRWATRSPGWIDYAFLGNGSRSDSISEIINQRGREDGSGVFYEPEQEGGRQRPDGKVLKWIISFPRQDERGITGTPFFCGDVTPRYLRVPSEPPENVQHSSGAIGIAYLRILVQSASFNAVFNQLKTVIGHDPVSSTKSESIWALDTTNIVQHPPQLILSIPNNDEETAFIKGSTTEIYEVGFRVHQGRKTGDTSPTYGRIAWRSQPQ
ncbi:hypothetical protein BYT27DRAFT_6599035 [Phlegmacium glaucopus]|nr:hypothetical protein BYT27DRAFT_6599035 [Phlegmacium glaucopus]